MCRRRRAQSHVSIRYSYRKAHAGPCDAGQCRWEWAYLPASPLPARPPARPPACQLQRALPAVQHSAHGRVGSLLQLLAGDAAARGLGEQGRERESGQVGGGAPWLKQRQPGAALSGALPQDSIASLNRIEKFLCLPKMTDKNSVFVTTIGPKSNRAAGLCTGAVSGAERRSEAAWGCSQLPWRSPTGRHQRCQDAG